MASNQVEPLRVAFAAARDSLAAVGPDRLADPTPCASWDVRALVNHMVGAPRAAARLLGQGDLPDALDFAAGDCLAAHDETAALVIGAFATPGVLEQTVDFPFGERPAGFLMLFVATDQLAHAWDLARVTDRSTDIAPGVAGELLEEARRVVTPDMRGEDVQAAFGPECAAGSDATEADRLAAFLGRTLERGR